MSQINSKPPGFAPEGTHHARCIGVIFIGTIEIAGKWQKKVNLVFEMPYHKRDYSHGSRGLEPKKISIELTASTYKGAHMGRYLMQWFPGSDIIKQFDQYFDPYVLIEEPAQITIRHFQKMVEGKEMWIEEICDIKAAEMDLPECYNITRVLQLDNTSKRPFDVETFNVLNKHVRDRIKRSQEWEKNGLAKAVEAYNKQLNPFETK